MEFRSVSRIKASNDIEEKNDSDVHVSLADKYGISNDEKDPLEPGLFDLMIEYFPFSRYKGIQADDLNGVFANTLNIKFKNKAFTADRVKNSVFVKPNLPPIRLVRKALDEMVDEGVLLKHFIAKAYRLNRL